MPSSPSTADTTLHPARPEGARQESKARAAGRSPDARARYHNFDTIRLWAAIGVLFTHSFTAAEGNEDHEPFSMLTGETLGVYGVYVFFILSGYLITRSRMTTPTTWQYLLKRFLRIYPAYFVSVVLVACIAGLFFSQRPFFGLHGALHGIAHAMVFDIEKYFVSTARFYPEYLGPVLNVVLWTLQIEVLMYIAVAILHPLRLLRFWVCVLLAIVGLITHLTGTYLMIDYGRLNLHLWGLGFGVPAFFAGAAFYFLFQKYPPRGDIALGLAIASLVVPLIDLSWLGITSHMLFPVLAAYPVIWLGSPRAPDLGNWARYGDFSYGLYIFGWPVQQLLRAAVGPDWSGWAFFPLCLPVALLMAVASWWLIERPALKWRPRSSVPMPTVSETDSEADPRTGQDTEAGTAPG